MAPPNSPYKRHDGDKDVLTCHLASDRKKKWTRTVEAYNIFVCKHSSAVMPYDTDSDY